MAHNREELLRFPEGHVLFPEMFSGICLKCVLLDPSQMRTTIDE